MSNRTLLHYFEQELKHSKSKYVSWGRHVIRAIDLDSPADISRIFLFEKDERNSNINEQVTMDGYGGYIWTTRLHLFDGDTALHLALKQKKRKCAGMLIFLGANTQIRNVKGELPEDICLTKYGYDLSGICRDARSEILPLIDPRGFDFVPKELRVHNVVKEAWSLMRAGRMLYTEIPKSFFFNDVEEESEKVNNWVRCIDEKTKTAYMWNQKTGESRTLDEKEEKELATHWVKEKDPIGRKYYLNQVTGATTWEKPQYYEDSDDEVEEDDDEAFLELKRLRQLEAVEELKKQKLEEEALARGVSLEDEMKEQARKKKERIEKRKLLKQQEYLTGVSCTPAGLAQGDSFGRDRISDMVQILEKQNLRYRKIEQSEALQHSGLALMKGVTVNGDEQEFPAGVSDELLRNLPKLEGLKRLRFIRIQAIHKMMSHLNADKGHKSSLHNETNDLELPVRFITELSTQTNLKYYNIGDSGLLRLNKELNGNKFITRISLNAARLTSASVCELASILKNIHALEYLDLSQNGICDKGIIALADVIVPEVHHVTNVLSRFSIEDNHHIDSHKSLSTKTAETVVDKPLPLKVLVLSANRITSVGAKKLVQSFCEESCKIQRLLMKRNPKIDRDTQRSLKKQVNECNEIEQKKHIIKYTSSDKNTLKTEKRSLSPNHYKKKGFDNQHNDSKIPPFLPKQLDI